MTVIRKQNNIFTPRNTETGGNLHMFKKLLGYGEEETHLNQTFKHNLLKNG